MEAKQIFYQCKECRIIYSDECEDKKCPDCGEETDVYDKERVYNYLSVKKLVNEYFDDLHVFEDRDGFFFYLKDKTSVSKEFVYKISDLGYLPFKRYVDGKSACRLMKTGKRKEHPISVHILLFLLTLATTTMTGYVFSADLYQMKLMQNLWVGAFSYSIALLFILGSHELAHWLTARKYGIRASFPYFIPMIPVVSLGTLGAVINIRTPPPDRETMIRMGFSGPFIGLLASVLIIYYGLHLSPMISVSDIKPPFMSMGEPLIFKVLIKIVCRIPEGYDILLHPLAMAGWFALIVNGFNLLPVGQLDGGHIARAFLSSRNHRILSYSVVAALFAMGLFLWRGWLVLGTLSLILAFVGNPGAIDEETAPEISGKLMTVAGIIILVLSITPRPIYVVTPDEKVNKPKIISVLEIEKPLQKGSNKHLQRISALRQS